MSELAAEGIPVAVTCRVLKLARQPYYPWLNTPLTENQIRRRDLIEAIGEVHRDDPEFGYRFVADEIREAGWEVCDRTVWRICSQQGWWSSFTK